MPGRKVHLIAAAAVFTVLGASTAGAGGLFTGNNCCAPVVWGCQSTCGYMPNIIYGTGYGYGYGPQVYPVNQGPAYYPSALPYAEPAYEPGYGEGAYPYVAPYGGYGYPFMYPGYRRHGFGFRHFAPRQHFGHRFAPVPHFRTGMHRPAFVGHRFVGPRHGFVGPRPMMRPPMHRMAPRGRW
jgi:hypothetical protein